MLTTEFKYTLQDYKGKSSRFTCPACGHKNEFVRYIDTLTNQPIADDVGRCNRAARCGYHKKPGEYFRENPQINRLERVYSKSAIVSRVEARLQASAPVSSGFDVMDGRAVADTLGEALYGQNNLAKYLIHLLGEEAAGEALRAYHVGTTERGFAAFWYCDGKDFRGGKVIRYGIDGHRQGAPFWDKPDRFKMCLFGRHLLWFFPSAPVFIFESEKTAVIASAVYPDAVCLATGGAGNLNADLCDCLLGREVTLWPDADKAGRAWLSIADDLRRAGHNVLVNDSVFESGAPDGSDFADVLATDAEGRAIL